MVIFPQIWVRRGGQGEERDPEVHRVKGQVVLPGRHRGGDEATRVEVGPGAKLTTYDKIHSHLNYVDTGCFGRPTVSRTFTRSP